MALGHHGHTASLLAVLLVVWLSAASHAAPIRIEAEAYVDSLNVGGARILAPDSILYGLDSPGDLTRYNLAMTEFGVYSIVLRVWGETGVSYIIRLIVEEPGEDERVFDFQFVGKGACGH